jgi:hypothetical protein
MSFITQLPAELQQQIYSYDNTYKKIMDHIIRYDINDSGNFMMNIGAHMEINESAELPKFYKDRGNIIIDEVSGFQRYSTKARHLWDIYADATNDDDDEPMFEEWLLNIGLNYEPDANETVFIGLHDLPI